MFERNNSKEASQEDGNIKKLMEKEQEKETKTQDKG